MKIYFHEPTRSLVVTQDILAHQYIVPQDTDPIDFAKRIAKHMKERGLVHNYCKLIFDSNTHQVPQPPTPNADALKDEGIPKGLSHGKVQ